MRCKLSSYRIQSDGICLQHGVLLLFGQCANYQYDTRRRFSIPEYFPLCFITLMPSYCNLNSMISGNFGSLVPGKVTCCGCVMLQCFAWGFIFFFSVLLVTSCWVASVSWTQMLFCIVKMFGWDSVVTSGSAWFFFWKIFTKSISFNMQFGVGIAF